MNDELTRRLRELLAEWKETADTSDKVHGRVVDTVKVLRMCIAKLAAVLDTERDRQE